MNLIENNNNNNINIYNDNIDNQNHQIQNQNQDDILTPINQETFQEKICRQFIFYSFACLISLVFLCFTRNLVIKNNQNQQLQKMRILEDHQNQLESIDSFSYDPIKVLITLINIFIYKFFI